MDTTTSNTPSSSTGKASIRLSLAVNQTKGTTKKVSEDTLLRWFIHLLQQQLHQVTDPNYRLSTIPDQLVSAIEGHTDPQADPKTQEQTPSDTKAEEYNLKQPSHSANTTEPPTNRQSQVAPSAAPTQNHAHPLFGTEKLSNVAKPVLQNSQDLLNFLAIHAGQSPSKASTPLFSSLSSIYGAQRFYDNGRIKVTIEDDDQQTFTWSNAPQNNTFVDNKRDYYQQWWL
ncbi:MAG: hypothetical protein CR991_00420 [Proteobacteria bacterium]|nr:MAG: hypothetical protein CR991_00420 [Pseudomonadota bacterium]